MTNEQRVAEWHRDKPEWAAHLTARDWDTAELVARQLDAVEAPEQTSCTRAPAGRYCTREEGHAGSCRTFPIDD
jgi:hypothetical protein